MLRTAWLLTGGDWALAEDLAQAAFSEVWRHWPRFSVMEAPEAYAHKVMLNPLAA
jgi:DNA-directed RNA polymerase specialized sigma24 family protein